jgi:hypothetical protein
MCIERFSPQKRSHLLKKNGKMNSMVHSLLIDVKQLSIVVSVFVPFLMSSLVSLTLVCTQSCFFQLHGNADQKISKFECN